MNNINRLIDADELDESSLLRIEHLLSFELCPISNQMSVNSVVSANQLRNICFSQYYNNKLKPFYKDNPKIFTEIKESLVLCVLSKKFSSFQLGDLYKGQIWCPNSKYEINTQIEDNKDISALYEQLMLLPIKHVFQTWSK